MLEVNVSFVGDSAEVVKEAMKDFPNNFAYDKERKSEFLV